MFFTFLGKHRKETSGRKDTLIFWFSVHGSILTVIEISCYLILYHHIYIHNKTTAEKKLLDSSIIRKRNQDNTVSLTGLFLTFLMEVWYIVLVGILSIVFQNDCIYAASAFVMAYERVFVDSVSASADLASAKKVNFRSNQSSGRFVI